MSWSGRPAGTVTTVDIDPDVTDRASACLGAAGYNGVIVVCADAVQPVEPDRRWDLIIVTAGAWDVAPAWREQFPSVSRRLCPGR